MRRILVRRLCARVLVQYLLRLRVQVGKWRRRGLGRRAGVGTDSDAESGTEDG